MDNIDVGIRGENYEVSWQVVTDGVYYYDDWKDSPTAWVVEHPPKLRILYLYDEQGNEWTQDVLTKKEYKTIMDILEQTYWDGVFEAVMS